MFPLTVTWLPVVVPARMPPLPPVPKPVSGDADVPADGPGVRSAGESWPKALAGDGAGLDDAPSDASGVGPGAGTGVGAGPVVGPEPTWVCRSIGEVPDGCCSAAAARAPPPRHT